MNTRSGQDLIEEPQPVSLVGFNWRALTKTGRDCGGRLPTEGGHPGETVGIRQKYNLIEKKIRLRRQTPSQSVVSREISKTNRVRKYYV